MKLYTVDRAKTLKTGMRLELFTDRKYNVDSPVEVGVNKLIESWFPDGVAEHGNTYIFRLPNMLPEKMVMEYPAFICESVFELIRQLQFPDRLSRFQSVFATDEENLDEMIARIAQGTDYNVFELNCDKYEKYDMNWVKGNTFAVCSYAATRYWSGAVSDNPLFEYLVHPPVVVSEQIIPK